MTARKPIAASPAVDRRDLLIGAATSVLAAAAPAVQARPVAVHAPAQWLGGL